VPIEVEMEADGGLNMKGGDIKQDVVQDEGNVSLSTPGPLIVQTNIDSSTHGINIEIKKEITKESCSTNITTIENPSVKVDISSSRNDTASQTHAQCDESAEPTKNGALMQTCVHYSNDHTDDLKQNISKQKGGEETSQNVDSENGRQSLRVVSTKENSVSKHGVSSDTDARKLTIQTSAFDHLDNLKLTDMRNSEERTTILSDVVVHSCDVSDDYEDNLKQTILDSVNGRTLEEDSHMKEENVVKPNVSTLANNHLSLNTGDRQLTKQTLAFDQMGTVVDDQVEKVDCDERNVTLNDEMIQTCLHTLDDHKDNPKQVFSVTKDSEEIVATFDSVIGRKLEEDSHIKEENVSTCNISEVTNENLSLNTKGSLFLNSNKNQLINQTLVLDQINTVIDHQVEKVDCDERAVTLNDEVIQTCLHTPNDHEDNPNQVISKIKNDDESVSIFDSVIERKLEGNTHTKQDNVAKCNILKVTNANLSLNTGDRQSTKETLAPVQTDTVVGNQVDIEYCDEKDVILSNEGAQVRLHTQNDHKDNPKQVISVINNGDESVVIFDSVKRKKLVEDVNIKEENTHKPDISINVKENISLNTDDKQLTKQTLALNQMNTVFGDQVDKVDYDERAVTFSHEVMQACLQSTDDHKSKLEQVLSEFKDSDESVATFDSVDGRKLESGSYMKEGTIHKSHISKATNHKQGTKDILALDQMNTVVGNQVEIENCDERDVPFSDEVMQACLHTQNDHEDNLEQVISVINNGDENVATFDSVKELNLEGDSYIKEGTIHKPHILKDTTNNFSLNTGDRQLTREISVPGHTDTVVSDQVEIENCDERDVSFSDEVMQACLHTQDEHDDNLEQVISAINNGDESVATFDSVKRKKLEEDSHMKEGNTHKPDISINVNENRSLNFNNNQLSKETLALNQMDTVVGDQVDKVDCDERAVTFSDEVMQTFLHSTDDDNLKHVISAFKDSDDSVATFDSVNGSKIVDDMNMKEDNTHKHNDTLDTSINFSLHANDRKLTKQTSALDQRDTVVRDQGDTECCHERVVLLSDEVIQACLDTQDDHEDNLEQVLSKIKDGDESVATFDSVNGRKLVEAVKIKEENAHKLSISTDTNDVQLSNQISALDHLDALGLTCDQSSVSRSVTQMINTALPTPPSLSQTSKPETRINKRNVENVVGCSILSFDMAKQKRVSLEINSSSNGCYERLESSVSIREGRDRAESWGAMSDISHSAGMGAATAAAIAATAIQRTRFSCDVNSATASIDVSSPIEIPVHVSSSNMSATGSVVSPSCNVETLIETAGIKGVPMKIEVIQKEEDDGDSVPSAYLDCFFNTGKGRDRLDSLASISELISRKERQTESMSQPSLVESAILTHRDRLDSFAVDSAILSQRDTLDSISLGDIPLCMSMTEHIADIAGDLESVVAHTSLDGTQNCKDINTFNVCKTESSMHLLSHSTMTASLGTQGRIKNQLDCKYAAKVALPPPTIHVDSEAVQAAVVAAMAATDGKLEFLKSPTKSYSKYSHPHSDADLHLKETAKKSLTNTKETVVSGAIMLPVTKMDSIIAEARAAAGYVHPINGSRVNYNPKKRLLSNTLPSVLSLADSTYQQTPKKNKSANVGMRSNKYLNSVPLATNLGIYTTPKKSLSSKGRKSLSVTPKRKNISSSRKVGLGVLEGLTISISTPKGGQSNQKWGEMFECLLQYKEEQRKKQTIGLSDKEREEWKWDGNVPTMYKVRCDIPRTPCKCYMVNFKFILFIL